MQTQSRDHCKRHSKASLSATNLRNNDNSADVQIRASLRHKNNAASETKQTMQVFSMQEIVFSIFFFPVGSNKNNCRRNQGIKILVNKKKF